MHHKVIIILEFYKKPRYNMKNIILTILSQLIISSKYNINYIKTEFYINIIFNTINL